MALRSLRTHVRTLSRFSNAALPGCCTRLDNLPARSVTSGKFVAPAVLASSVTASIASAQGITTTTVSPTMVWWMESCVGVGGISMGLPGLAAQACFLAPLDAMKKIKADMSVGQLPLLPYSAMCVNGLTWITYGLVIENPAVWAPNLSALALGLYYWYTFAKFCPKGANHLPGPMLWHFLGAAAVSSAVIGSALMLDKVVAQNVIGVIGDTCVVAMFGGPLAAIKTVLAEKSTASLPFIFTVATFANCSLWTVYGTVVLNDLYIWLPNSLGLAAAVVQLSLFARFGFGRK